MSVQALRSEKETALEPQNGSLLATNGLHKKTKAIAEQAIHKSQNSDERIKLTSKLGKVKKRSKKYHKKFRKLRSQRADCIPENELDRHVLELLQNSAKVKFDRAFQLIEEKNYPIAMDELDRALLLFQEALEGQISIKDEQNCKLYIGSCYHHYAVIFYALDQIDRAIQLNKTALGKLNEVLKDHIDETEITRTFITCYYLYIKIYVRKANAYRDGEEFEKASCSYKEALERLDQLAKSVTTNDDLAISFNDMGNINLELGNIAKEKNEYFIVATHFIRAIEKFYESLRFQDNEDISSKIQKIISQCSYCIDEMIRIGDNYRTARKYIDSLIQYQKASEIVKKVIALNTDPSLHQKLAEKQQYLMIRIRS